MVSDLQSYGQEIAYKLEYVMVLLIVLPIINYTSLNWNNKQLVIFIVVSNINENQYQQWKSKSGKVMVITINIRCIVFSYNYNRWTNTIQL